MTFIFCSVKFIWLWSNFISDKKTKELCDLIITVSQFRKKLAAAIDEYKYILYSYTLSSHNITTTDWGS